jgi:hypothetical protein
MVAITTLNVSIAEFKRTLSAQWWHRCMETLLGVAVADPSRSSPYARALYVVAGLRKRLLPALLLRSAGDDAARRLAGRWRIEPFEFSATLG